MTNPVPDVAVATLEKVAARRPQSTVALVVGVFDGVHRGHRVMLAAAREAAAARGAQPVAIVFDPPPIEVIRPGQVVERLAPLAENLARIRAAGVEAIPLRFDPALRELAAEEFLDRLAPGLRVAAVPMTPGSAFGRDRAGTPDRLAAIGLDRGFEVVRVDPEHDDGPISSSRIREFLAAGDLPTATRLLGRRPALTGTVIRGDGRGRALGYPTANLAFAYRPALPALGIYAGFVDGLDGAGGGLHGALLSIGRRPTFHDDGEVVVEAHLLDWDGDLYGRQIRLELVSPLREERRFESADELVAQMHRDETAARGALTQLV